MIRPVEYNVAVKVDPVEEKTKGGLYLTSDTQERSKHKAERGTISHISPMAFSFDDWPDGEPKPKVGDRVIFAKFAGMFVEEGGEEFRVMKDRDIVAVIDEASISYNEWLTAAVDA